MQFDHDVSSQAIAAAELIRALGSDAADADLVHDTVEGETGFFEAVEAALAEIFECDIQISGLKDMRKQLSDRQARIEGRRERLRGLIDQAFQMAEIQSHAFPAATVSQKSVPPSVVVTDEAQIPSEFFKPQPPKLDMAALKDALKSRAIPGASMSNGGKTIQIRRT